MQVVEVVLLIQC